MKFKFPVVVEDHQRPFVRDDQGRQIVSITVKEQDAADENAADALVAKAKSAKASELMEWGKRRAMAMVGLCVVAYEHAGTDGASVEVKCQTPNDAFRGWSPKAKALASAFYGELNGADESETDEAFRRAQVAT